MSDEFKPAGNQVILGYAISTNASVLPTTSIAHVTDSAPISDFVMEQAVTFDLPEAVLVQIGRAMSIWAFVEWVLAGTLCNLLRTNRKVGRELFQGMRTKQLLDSIRKLMDIESVSVSTQWPDLRKNLEEGERRRNLLAHGVWTVHPENGTLSIQNPSGEWKIGNTVVESKRRIPEAFTVTGEWLTETINDMLARVKEVNQFDAEITAAMGQ